MEIAIDIDRDVCIGSGNCAHFLPAVFDLDDEGISTVVNAEGASPAGLPLCVTSQLPGRGCHGDVQEPVTTRGPAPQQQLCGNCPDGELRGM